VKDVEIKNTRPSPQKLKLIDIHPSVSSTARNALLQ